MSSTISQYNGCGNNENTLPKLQKRIYLVIFLNFETTQKKRKGAYSMIFDDNRKMIFVKLHNQRTNGPVNAHLISGPAISKKTKFAEFDIDIK